MMPLGEIKVRLLHVKKHADELYSCLFSLLKTKNYSSVHEFHVSSIKTIQMEVEYILSEITKE